MFPQLDDGGGKFERPEEEIGGGIVVGGLDVFSASIVVGGGLGGEIGQSASLTQQSATESVPVDGSDPYEDQGIPRRHH